MRQVSDRELYLRCCQGDEEAWSYLYGYVLSITRWARWGLGDVAEDVAQAVVLHLMERGLAMVRSADAFRSFVRRTTINRVLDHYRSGEVRFRHRGRPPEAGDRPEADPVLSRPDAGPTVEAQAVSRHDLARWSPLLERLPGYCREVLQAYMEYRLGLVESYREIAERLGRPINTVSVQIKRCLEHFRQAAVQAGLVESP
ncbi:MAG: RNA polymerase sigma factor [Nitrospinota bacterium]